MATWRTKGGATVTWTKTGERRGRRRDGIPTCTPIGTWSCAGCGTSGTSESEWCADDHAQRCRRSS